MYINIQYTLDVHLKMGMMQQDVKKSIEFIVEIPVALSATSLPGNGLLSDVFYALQEDAKLPVKPAKLNITPASVERMHSVRFACHCGVTSIRTPGADIILCVARD